MISVKASIFIFYFNRYFNFYLLVIWISKHFSYWKTTLNVESVTYFVIMWFGMLKLKANKVKYLFHIAFNSVIKYLKKGYIDK